MAGLNLSIAAAGMNKAIQKLRGYPDLLIIKPHPNYHSLFIELKPEGTKLKKKNGEWATPHIAEQAEALDKLSAQGFKAVFAVGWSEAKKTIDDYLK